MLQVKAGAGKVGRQVLEILTQHLVREGKAVGIVDALRGRQAMQPAAFALCRQQVAACAVAEAGGESQRGFAQLLEARGVVAFLFGDKSGLRHQFEFPSVGRQRGER